MNKLLIAYNNAVSEELHDVFEACADEAKAICARHCINFHCVNPPNLTKENICGKIAGFQMLFIAAHGSDEAIYNEKEDDNEVVSVRTTNYDFNGKCFYSVSCSTAKKLAPELQRIGLKLFVGYDDKFWVQGDITPFYTCALSGLEYFLSGDTVSEARRKMLKSFDDKINELNKTNPLAARWLTHNKMHLCFEGEDELKFEEL